MKYEAGLLARTAVERFADRPALTFHGVNQTYGELNETANCLGSGLRALGIDRGDRVGLLAVNCPEVVQTWLACEAFALVRVAMHTHSEMADHVALLNHVGAKALVFDTRFTDALSPLLDTLRTEPLLVAIGPDCPPWAIPFADVVSKGSPDDQHLEVDEDDPCFLQLTSGTTGMSKPWVKTYRSWLAVINQNATHLDTFDGGRAIGPEDVNLHFHPLQWATGFQTLYPYLIRGARTVIMPDDPFEAEAAVDTIIEQQVTGTFAPGPLLSPILDVIEGRGGIEHKLTRVVVFFGSPELLARTSKWLGPVWAHGFGSTEQGAVTTRLLPSDVARDDGRLNSVGRAASPNIEIAVMDPEGARLPAGQVGEIAVRSAMSQGSYWGMPDRTAAAYFPGDWFRSGDVGYLDSAGFLFYGDRAGDTIRLADGSVVYPHLVEGAVLSHEAVGNCGVVAIDLDGHQEIIAAVQLKPGAAASDALAADILGHASTVLTPKQTPDHLAFLDELPTVLGGAKVQRAVLRDQLVDAR